MGVDGGELLVEVFKGSGTFEKILKVRSQAANVVKILVCSFVGSFDGTLWWGEDVKAVQVLQV